MNNFARHAFYWIQLEKVQLYQAPTGAKVMKNLSTIHSSPLCTDTLTQATTANTSGIENVDQK